MNVNEGLIEKLGLPDLSQMGIVVRDLDATIEFYKNVLGLGPFVKPEVNYLERTYHGEAVDSFWIMGFCSLGAVELEIIQPIRKPTIYHDFLEQKGEGIHHFGFDLKEGFDEKLLLCQKLGIGVMQSGRSETGRFAFLDTEKIGGVIFELIQRKSRRI